MSQASIPSLEVGRTRRKRPQVSNDEEDIVGALQSSLSTKPSTKTKQARKHVLAPATPGISEVIPQGQSTRSQTGGSTEKENNPADKLLARQKEQSVMPRKLSLNEEASISDDSQSAHINVGTILNDSEPQNTHSSNVRPEDDTQGFTEEEIRMTCEQEMQDETQEHSLNDLTDTETDTETSCSGGGDTSEPPQSKKTRLDLRHRSFIQKHQFSEASQKKSANKSDVKNARKLSDVLNEKKERRRKKEMAKQVMLAIEQEKRRGGKLKAIVDFMKEQKESTRAPAGVIKKIKFNNFMCHDSFEKEWNPNLNFITGENGSGKSSILNGIIIGLGARAAVTSRTKSIKSLIKDGQSCAKTEITLGNNGVLSTDKYGDEFTIQRVIDQNGTSTYKLKAHGRFRPLRKTELDGILLSLGIQLDNPVSILNQETARSFLQSKDPKDKYKLFCSGALLDKCESIIFDTNHDLSAVDAHLNAQIKIIYRQREELSRLDKMRGIILQVEKMKEKLNNLENEYAWSLVLAAEKSKAQLEHKLSGTDKNILKLKSDHAEILNTKNILINEQMDETEKNRLKVEIRNNNAQIENMRRSHAAIRKNMAEAEAIMRSANNLITSETKSIKELETTVESLKARTAELEELAKKEFEDKLKGFVEEKEKLLQEISTLRNDTDQFKHGSAAIRKAIDGLEENRSGINRTILRRREELDLLNKSLSNKFTPYGRHIQELVAKIQANANRFKNLPRGPLGACFTVKDDKWLKIIEFVLKAHLFNFVVDECQSDQNVLDQLIKQTYGERNQGGGVRRPDVYIKKFESQPLDITSGNASMPDHPTILDAIEIENNDFIVRNALIDFAKIEKMLLFENTQIGVKTLSNCNRPDFPRNCLQGFSTDFFRISPAPRLRVDPLPNFRQANFLKSTKTAQKKYLQQAIADLENEIIQIKPVLDEKKKEERRLRLELDSRNQAQKQLERQLHFVTLKIEQVNKTPYKAPDITTYIEEMEDKKSEVSKAQQRVDSAKQSYESEKLKAVELNANKINLEASVQELQAKLVELDSASDTHRERLNKLESIISRFEQKLKDSERKKGQHVATLQQINADLEQKIASASKSSATRIITERDSNTIKEEVTLLKQKIAQSQKTSPDKEKIKEDFRKVKKAFQNKMGDFELLYLLFDTCKDLTEAHQAHFIRTRTEIGNLLTGCFLGLLGPRQYKGRLIIDHDNKEIYYFVCSEEANAEANHILNSCSTKEIKRYMAEYAGGLSGGERSFATICFVIAMWQVMECPFFMLDEFDVFMDTFNRKSSQAALICHAQSYRSHQFFFFTPLDLTMQPDPNLSSVLRLFPPVRGRANDPTLSVIQDDIEDDEGRTPEPSSRARKRQRRN